MKKGDKVVTVGNGRHLPRGTVATIHEVHKTKEGVEYTLRLGTSKIRARFQGRHLQKV